ncbi:MAG: hypothetical protein JWP75_3430 [Frondihabitans sp.]|nr:hypothetical protein [Frondihabitans sp.]
MTISFKVPVHPAFPVGWRRDLSQNVASETLTGREVDRRPWRCSNAACVNHNPANLPITGGFVEG